jgi:hypothetical protein
MANTWMVPTLGMATLARPGVRQPGSAWTTLATLCGGVHETSCASSGVTGDPHRLATDRRCSRQVWRNFYRLAHRGFMHYCHRACLVSQWDDEDGSLCDARTDAPEQLHIRRNCIW